MNDSTTTYDLKPNWSRMLHRFYTLGITQQHYNNDIATLNTEGEYPRLVPTASEDKTFSIRGDHEWLLDTWKNGSVTVDPRFRTAEFRFSSEAEKDFHSVRLTPESHWDCFQCLLNLYAMEQTEAVLQNKTEKILENAQLNTHIAKLAKAVNRELIRGKKIFCSLPISGGSMLKNFELKSLMTQFGRVALKKENTNHSSLILKPEQPLFTKVNQNMEKFSAIIYNSKAEPQLYLSAV